MFVSNAKVERRYFKIDDKLSQNSDDPTARKLFLLFFKKIEDRVIEEYRRETNKTTEQGIKL